MSFTHSKNTRDPLPASTTSFSLKCASGTDLYRKPGENEIANAPMIYKSFAVNKFHSARVTIKPIKWARLWDQGGLVVMLPHFSPVRWVKTGLEVNDGYLNISSVSADRFADWSLIPLSEEDGRKEHTIEIERKKAGLKIYLVSGEDRKLTRGVTWFFEGVEDGQEIQIGVTVARPTKEGKDKDELEIFFENFEVKLLDDKLER